MRVLAIDTSTSDLVTGVVDTTTQHVVDRVVVDTRAHNELLMPTIMELMTEAGCSLAQLDAIVVGCGPGPFTGLRVGMSTASALGVALKIPVHGVCSLDAIALGALGASAAPGATNEVLVCTDARRKEVYWATYRDGVRTAGPDVSKPEDVAPQVGAVIIPEALAARLPQQLQGLPRTEGSPRARHLVAVAAAQFTLDEPAQPLVPLYLRRPDAVPPAPKPISPALVHAAQPQPQAGQERA